MTGHRTIMMFRTFLFSYQFKVFLTTAILRVLNSNYYFSMNLLLAGFQLSASIYFTWYTPRPLKWIFNLSGHEVTKTTFPLPETLLNRLAPYRGSEAVRPIRRLRRASLQKCSQGRSDWPMLSHVGIKPHIGRNCCESYLKVIWQRCFVFVFGFCFVLFSELRTWGTAI